MSQSTTESDRLIDDYREQVTGPLRRLFREYGHFHARWLGLGLLASIVTHAATLVTPIVIGTTIDAVFTGESEYALPLVPQPWLPTEPAAQFWLSAGLVGTALLLSALLAWVRGVAMNFFAHGVMFSIRTDAYEKMQRLDMTFFDNKETGEIMSILNNDTSNLEIFLDNALSESVRIGVLVVGITSLLVSPTGNSPRLHSSRFRCSSPSPGCSCGPSNRDTSGTVTKSATSTHGWRTRSAGSSS